MAPRRYVFLLARARSALVQRAQTQPRCAGAEERYRAAEALVGSTAGAALPDGAADQPSLPTVEDLRREFAEDERRLRRLLDDVGHRDGSAECRRKIEARAGVARRPWLLRYDAGSNLWFWHNPQLAVDAQQNGSRWCPPPAEPQQRSLMRARRKAKQNRTEPEPEPEPEPAAAGGLGRAPGAPRLAVSVVLGYDYRLLPNEQRAVMGLGSGPPLCVPCALALDRQHNALFISERHRIRRKHPAGPSGPLPKVLTGFSCLQVWCWAVLRRRR